jgi:polyisoprenyl-phosphate glycosyltransferase
MLLSIVTPAYNEESNLAAMHQRLDAAMAALGVDWEWIIVDDHSRDATFEVTRALAARDPRVRGLRLARNSGSHTAITCGLHHASGDAAVVLAADLQDPPEVVGAVLSEWQGGAQVVWAVRRQRPGQSMPALGFSRVYYFIMRRLVGMTDMPASGADFFLVDRVVLDAFRGFSERHVSVLALITWMGYRQARVEYDKQPRLGGRSGWTLGKKVKLVIDSVTGFSDFPIKMCSAAGAALLAAALLMMTAAVVLLPAFRGGVLLVVSVGVGLAGIQLLALGVIGEYVWRALDEVRRRPPYLIEAAAGVAATPVARAHD